MVDREQQQARLLADSMGPDGRAGRDLAWIVAVSVVLAAAAVASGIGERFLSWAGGLEDTDLSGLLALLVVVPVGATVYAVRRYRDADRARARLRELSFSDSLTGLPNRRFLGEPFEAMLATARRRGSRLAVLFVDLDGFKKINDTHGHEVGDELMVVVADRLRRAVGPDDTVVRYGGDEFVILCADVTTASSAERIAKRILQAIETPFEIGAERLRVSGSVGITLTEDRPGRPDEILSDADAAMYQAKARGPGTYALFDRSMRERITPATAERRLREALERGEFRLYYQPIVSLWTKRLVGVEALLRWHDPRRGIVGCEEFLGPLEETGLIVPVGSWVLEEVCRQCRAWQDAHPDRPALNVKLNVSARELAQADFVTRLGEALERSGADPDRICLEVSEHALMVDVETIWSTLRDAKRLGVSLALDDFGTGYSSLSRLRHFNLDLLSIDRSFIDGVGRSREDTTIVEHVVAMAKALGIVTVAEGVTDETQVTHLRSLNCDLAQGWYFSRPQPPEIISALLAEGGNRHEWRPPERAPAAETSNAVVRLARFDPVRPPG